jgi:CRISPR-associated protein Csm3
MAKEEGEMKLRGFKDIEGIIEVITGLHIGGGTTIIEIGGNDNPVIKHPITKEPYIPGSSLKGRMRSLLEWKLGLIDTRVRVNGEENKEYGEVHKYGSPGCQKTNCPVCVIFGTSAEDAALGPTRLIVRDAFVDKDFKAEEKKKDDTWTIFNLMEDKYENAINRITARANPRPLERVVAGTKFNFRMRYRIFDSEDNCGGDESRFKYIVEALKLVEGDALGGAGSRGCGQVKFRIQVGTDDWRDLDQISPSNLSTLFPTKAETA